MPTLTMRGNAREYRRQAINDAHQIDINYWPAVDIAEPGLHRIREHPVALAIRNVQPECKDSIRFAQLTHRFFQHVLPKDRQWPRSFRLPAMPSPQHETSGTESCF